MKVLIVDAFINPSPQATHGRGKTGFDLFHATILKLIGESAKEVPGAELLAQSTIQVVKADRLQDSKIIFEIESIDADSKIAAENFDLIDIIFAVGDPNPFAYPELITLCHLAYLSDKPMLTCGGAALADVIAFCGKGKRFNVLNGPMGCSIDSLQSFPSYSHASTPNFESAFFAAETGDMYVFQNGKWHPQCSIGLHRRGKRGKLLSPRANVSKLVTCASFACDDHVKNSPREIEALSSDLDAKLYIHSEFSQHWAIKGLCTAALAFIVTCLGEWVVNKSWINARIPYTPHAIPKVLASSVEFPALIEIGNKLIIACEVNDKHLQNIALLLRNFLLRTMPLILDPVYEKSKEHRSLLTMFFCNKMPDELSTCKVCPALAIEPVISTLPDGPTKLANFLYRGKSGINEASIQTTMADAPRRRSTGQYYSGRTVQNPTSLLNQRLASIIVANGQSVPTSLQLIHSDTAAQIESATFSPVPPRDFKPSRLLLRSKESGIKNLKPFVDSLDSPLDVTSNPIPALHVLTALSSENSESSECLAQKSRIFIECSHAFIPHRSPRSVKRRTHDSLTEESVKRVFYNPNPDHITATSCTLKASLKSSEQSSKNNNSPYSGQYTEVFLSTFEKRIKHEFSQGKPFITSRVALPLRKEGQIRAFSKYEDNQTAMVNIKLQDRAGLRTEEKEKHLCGAWKK